MIPNPDWKQGTIDARRSLVREVEDWTKTEESVEKLIFRLKTKKVEPFDRLEAGHLRDQAASQPIGKTAKVGDE